MGKKTTFWDEKIETMNLNELKKLQGKRLRQSVTRSYNESPYYREKLKNAGIKPDDINTIEDIVKLPFMEKDDFRKTFPYGLLAIPKSKLIRLHATSGTTGIPSTAYYTQNDLEIWTELIARNLTTIGVTSEDVFQNTVSHGLFTGGMGYLQGAQRVGALVIPFGGGHTQRQLEFMRDFGVTSFHAIPSFGLKLVEVSKQIGMDPEKDLSLRVGMLGAEFWSEGTRKRIEDGLGIDAFDNYGLTELVGPGVSCECQEKNGLHVWSDHFYAEIIDPETEETLDPGEEGELVLTALTKETFPSIRFRTRDITTLTEEPCACGRTHPRMSRVKGRIDDGFTIRGVTLFPRQVEEIVMNFPEIGYNYMVKLWTKGVMDEITVLAEVEEETFKDKENRAKLEDSLLRALYDNLLIRVSVEFLKEGGIPRAEGKAKRLLDERIVRN